MGIENIYKKLLNNKVLYAIFKVTIMNGVVS